MRVSFTGYNYDIETSSSYYDTYCGRYIEPNYQQITIEGAVQAYVREDGTTYAVVLSDANELYTVELSELRVLLNDR